VVEGVTARAIIVAAIIGAAILAAGPWSVQFLRQAMGTAETVASTPVAAAADAVQAVLGQGKPVVAEFGSGKCFSCREMRGILEALSREHGDRVNVASIDILANREYIPRYKIQAMPTQIFYDAQGREIGRHMGLIPAEDILLQLGLDPAAKKGGS